MTQALKLLFSATFLVVLIVGGIFLYDGEQNKPAACDGVPALRDICIKNEEAKAGR